MVAAGDELIHPAVTDQALADGNGKRDYSAILAGIKPVIEQAGLAICHLETPIAKASGPFLGYPKFSVPPELAPRPGRYRLRHVLNGLQPHP